MSTIDKNGNEGMVLFNDAHQKFQVRTVVTNWAKYFCDFKR
jgi:hypothetical protein